MSGAVILEFETEEAFSRAMAAARQEKLRVVDAFTPYAPEGIEGGPDAGAHVVTVAITVGGLVSAALFYLLQWWSAARAYPFDSGGRPANSWPTFMLAPVEFGVFAAGLCGFIAWLVRCGLPRPHHPWFEVPGGERATQDRYFLALEAGVAAEAFAGRIGQTAMRRVEL